MNKNVWSVVLLCCLFVTCPPAQAESWPCWRGSRGDGTCIEEGVPRDWNPDRAVWKTELPGKGYASPIV